MILVVCYLLTANHVKLGRIMNITSHPITPWIPEKLLQEARGTFSPKKINSMLRGKTYRIWLFLILWLSHLSQRLMSQPTKKACPRTPREVTPRKQMSLTVGTNLLDVFCHKTCRMDIALKV